jgi:type 1 glutamine amidotransferase
MQDSMRNLILTGGPRHPFATSAPALAALLAEQGIDSAVAEDIESGLAALGSGGYALVTVYALRWSMTQHEKYTPDRPRFQFFLSPRGRRAIVEHLNGGGGLLGLHTASICFDDWPEWRDVLGGAWVWGRSGHPPYGPVRVRLDRREHVLLRGLDEFEVQDEVYGGLDIVPNVTPLAHARAASGTWQPILWEHRVGAGRVVYDALGHDAASLQQSVHRRLVTRAALWALGRDERDVERA